MLVALLFGRNLHSAALSLVATLLDAHAASKCPSLAGPASEPGSSGRRSEPEVTLPVAGLSSAAAFKFKLSRRASESVALACQVFTLHSQS